MSNWQLHLLIPLFLGGCTEEISRRLIKRLVSPVRLFIVLIKVDRIVEKPTEAMLKNGGPTREASEDVLFILKGKCKFLTRENGFRLRIFPLLDAHQRSLADR